MTKKEILLRYVEGRGVVICRDYSDEQHQRARAAIARALSVCPPFVLDGLKLIYLFRQDEQPEPQFDGREWYYTVGDRTLYAIGISVEAVTYSPEYASALFLHECAHVLTNQGHTPYFYDCEGYLLECFNNRWGTNLKSV